MDEQEKADVKVGMRVAHLEEALSSIKDAVSELRDVVTVLAQIQVEQQHTNKKVEHILEKLPVPKSKQG